MVTARVAPEATGRHIIVNKEAGCCVFQASVQLPTKTTVAPVCSCEPAQARQPVSVPYVIRGVPARLTQLSPHRAAARPAPRKATALCLTAESVYARQKMSGVRRPSTLNYSQSPVL